MDSKNFRDSKPKTDWHNLILHPNKSSTIGISQKYLYSSNAKGNYNKNMRKINDTNGDYSGNINNIQMTEQSGSIKNTLIPVYCILLSLVIVVLGGYVVYKFIKQRTSSKSIHQNKAKTKGSKPISNSHYYDLEAQAHVPQTQPIIEIERILQQYPLEIIQEYAHRFNITYDPASDIDQVVKQTIIAQLKVSNLSLPNVLSCLQRDLTGISNDLITQPQTQQQQSSYSSATNNNNCDNNNILV